MTRMQNAATPHRRSVRRILGPGLVTGASDDDPSGIGTYSQAGAQFGYGLLWTLLFSYPLMVAIQEISARIGRITGAGIAANLCRQQPMWLARALVGSLAIANVVNLGADLGAMGAALKLLLPGPLLLYVCMFAVASTVLEVFVGYERYAAMLRWLCLSLLSYVACALVGDISWSQVARALTWPRISAEPGYAMAVVAILGTTISPYLFFWQAQEEVETNQGRTPRLRDGPVARSEFRRIHLDTVIGMGLSNVIAVCIVITTASALHAHGQTTIETAAQAAAALRQVAGRFTFVVFALGIVGTGVLAVPVLAGSAAYAVGESLSWRVGLSHPPHRARAFYGAIAVATALGCALNFTPINPIRALYWSAVLNGVVAVPVMVAMMSLSARPAVMGALTLPVPLRWLGWAATAAMACAVVVMLISWIV
jgi:Mn2+/Fe2+ NRAMP family transporter